MPILELARTRPDWFSALELALTRPESVPERRVGGDPWNPRPVARRITDDLAWFRQAIEDPVIHGLRELDAGARLPVWETEDDPELHGRLERLDDRGILGAAGFLLHHTVAS
jgi:hypothetical protein